MAAHLSWPDSPTRGTNRRSLTESFGGARGMGRESSRRGCTSAERGTVSGAVEDHDPAAKHSHRSRARTAVLAGLVVLCVSLVTAAGASAFQARGSADQVYVTGLSPNAQMSLL